MENLSGVNCEFKKIDILDFDLLRDVISNTDGVFHQAGLISVSESFTNQDKYHNVNVFGTENIFELAREFDKKIVFASSASVYGNVKSMPITEASHRDPINPYGITKLECEKMSVKYHKLGVSIIGLRYFNVYGVGQNKDYAGVITKFIEQIHSNRDLTIFGNGSQSRDFISVNEIVKANLLAMESKTEFALLNIGSGVSVSVKELAQLMIKLSGKSLGINYKSAIEGDIQNSLADVSFTKKIIGWTNDTTLEHGMKSLI